jgi:hypothetical protein
VQEAQIVNGDHQRAPPAERARVLHVQTIHALPCGRTLTVYRDAVDRPR